MNAMTKHFVIVSAVLFTFLASSEVKAQPRVCNYMISETVTPACFDTIKTGGVQEGHSCNKKYGEITVAKDGCTDQHIYDAVRTHLERSGRDPTGFNLNHIKYLDLEWRGVQSADKEVQRNPVQQE